MYVVINKDGQIYNGSYNGKHYWSDTDSAYLNVILIPSKSVADYTLTQLEAEDAKVVPVSDLK